MMDFSSVQNALQDFAFEETEEVCQKHNVSLVRFSEKNICPLCAEELTRQRDFELADKLTKNHYDSLQKQENAKKAENYIQKSLLNDRNILKATFTNYEVTDEETKINKHKARMVAKRYLNGEVFNTIFSGKVGTGKSHLAHSVLTAVNEHIEPKKKCLYVSAYKLLNTLRASYKQGVESENVKDELIMLCTDAYLLVLDDLGAEVGSKNNQKVAASDNFDLMNNIFENRMNLPTIITTNLSTAEIENTYDDRIRSRVISKADLNTLIKFEKTKDKRNKIEF